MPDRRFNVLPEEGFAPLRPAVIARWRDAARRACGESFEALFQGIAPQLLTRLWAPAPLAADDATERHQLFEAIRPLTNVDLLMALYKAAADVIYAKCFHTLLHRIVDLRKKR